MKVTLCGVAMSAFASSITATVLILDEQTLLAMRTRLAGDVAGVIGETIASAAGPLPWVLRWRSGCRRR